MKRAFNLIGPLGLALFIAIAWSGCDVFDPNDALRPPTVEILSPKGGNLVAGQVSVFIQTEAFLNSLDNRIERVNISIDGDAVGQAQRVTYGGKPVFLYTWNTPGIPDGQHRLQAEAIDSEGARGLSAPEMVVVENGLNNGPMVAIMQPTASQEVYGVSLILLSEIPNEPAVAEIDLLIDGVTVATLTGPNYSYEWNTLAESPGPHTIQAKAVGTNGLFRLSTPVTVQVTGG